MRTEVALLAFAVAGLVVVPVVHGSALAQTPPSPAPSASASPRPAASPAPSPSASALAAPEKKPKRLRVSIDSYTSATNQQFVGPGITGGAEAPNFASGGPLAPSVPYDFFSGSPTTTGEGISQDLLITPVYALFPTLDVSAEFGYGSLGGSGNVGAYWGDSLMPTINPHLGSQAATVVPYFSTHNGQQSVNATRVSVLQGTLALHNGLGALSGGWFNLRQTIPFVFQQAPQTNTPLQLVPQLPQSLGDGPPAADVFQGQSRSLQLQGYDAWGTFKTVTAEVSDADLPAMPGTMARETSFSAIDRLGDVSFGAEVAHLDQSGPVSQRFAFGANPVFVLDGSAVVPFSTITGQRMTIEGFTASFPVATADLAIHYGHSCYSADGVLIAAPSCTPGNYYYAKFHQGFSKFDLALEVVRFEPTYAPAVLPYGTIENVWSSPFAFPGTWLHGAYQFVDNSEVGPNRQGIRGSSTFLLGPVETRLSLAHYVQVLPDDLTTSGQTGFIEPYFSPQLTYTQGVRGTETHASAWFAWHPKVVDVTLELSDIVANRYAPAGRPQDNIAVDYPAAIASFSHTFGKWLTGFGAGRYGIHGTYDAVGVLNAQLSQNVEFVGLQLRANANTAYALQYQLFSVNGNPVIPGGLSPAYHGPQIQFYQLLRT